MKIDPTIIAAIIGLAGVLIGFLVTKKKYDLEVRKLESDLQNSVNKKTLIDEYREGMIIIAKKLVEKNFRPDIIITFTRNDTVLAGMYAPNMQIDDIISIPRHQESSPSNPSGDARQTLVVGKYLKLNSSELRDKRILVLRWLIDTGETHEDGIKYLRNQKITQEIELASMYVTPGALKRWPNMIYAFEITDTKGVFNNLPWKIGKEDYDFVPRKK